MEHQEQLFVGAVEAAILQAVFKPGEGWCSTLIVRRQFEEWADCRREVYEHLTTDELFDVLDVSLGSLRAQLGG